jgi:molybdenum cofactor biosynthesis enzyme MoaA
MNKSYKLTRKNPNFSLVVPGPCNAKCNFCFWKHEKLPNDYMEKLENVMYGNVLPDYCQQISLTGGEPTASPYLKTILNKVNKNKFKKVVLTSNGFKLNEHAINMVGIVDHLNISRHHFDDTINNSVFKTNTIPSKDSLKETVSFIRDMKIDITLNCVTSHITSVKEIEQYIEFAKEIQADHVSFRKPHGNIDATELENHFFKNYEILNEDKCPVCRMTEQIINDVHVVWRAGNLEPSKDTNGVYEFIMQQNGNITSDWDGKNRLDI